MPDPEAWEQGVREAMARAIWNSADDEVGWDATLSLAGTGDAYMIGQVEFVRMQVDRAIAALAAAGAKIVPMEATDEMKEAVWEVHHRWHRPVATLTIAEIGDMLCAAHAAAPKVAPEA